MEREYKLHLSSVTWNPAGSIVGSFRRREGGELICDIYLDDNEVYKAGQGSVCTVSYGSEARIFITEKMFEGLRGGEMTENFLLYRELGHIVLGHFKEDDSGEAADERYLREEIESDSFAADAVGLETALDSLRKELQAQVEYDRLRGRQGTEGSVKAIRLLKKRIAALKERKA